MVEVHIRNHYRLTTLAYYKGGFIMLEILYSKSNHIWTCNNIVVDSSYIQSLYTNGYEVVAEWEDSDVHIYTLSFFV